MSEGTVVDVVARIGKEVAAQHADAVDREARFPSETIDALKKAKMMSALVPKELGRARLRHDRARRDVRGARAALRVDARWCSRCTRSRWRASSATR